MMLIQLAIFVVLSAGLVYLSWPSLRSPRAHGFYRFLAWEAILALIILNARDWFRDPFSIRQIVSWLLLVISIVMLVAGVRRLSISGKPDRERQDDALIGFEKTSVLVTEGVYKYIRHPLYSSLLFLAWGVFLKLPSWPDAALTAVATLFLVVTALVEEQECIRFFGPAYQDYMRRTKMFIPFLI